MIFRLFFLIFTIGLSILNAKIKHFNLYVNQIDNYYKDRVNKSDFEELLKDVEKDLENQLNINFLSINKNKKGIPLNFIYIEPTKAQIKYEELIKETKEKKKYLDNLKTKYSQLQNQINKTELMLLKVRNYKQRNQINNLRNKLVIQNNKFVILLNKGIQQYNHFVEEIHKVKSFLPEGNKRTLGTTFGYVRTIKNISGKEEYYTPSKIDIYVIENYNQIKATLAHEIGHLIGIQGHTDNKKDLMYPYIQQEIIDNLKLSNKDKELFKENLNY
jgi:hypothetical protein